MIHDGICDRFPLLPLPPGSTSIEPYRIGVLCDGFDTALAVDSCIIQRVNEHNITCSDQEGFVPLRFHTFYAKERHVKNGYWGNATSQMAGKGNAVDFVRKHLGMEREQLICCGDSGNDISMMQLDGVNSVVVGNASHELLDFYEALSDEKRTNV